MLCSEDVLDADKLVIGIMSLSLEGDTTSMYVCVYYLPCWIYVLTYFYDWLRL